MFDAVKISQLPEVFTVYNKTNDYIVLNVRDEVTSKIRFVNFVDTITSMNLVFTGSVEFQGQVTLPDGTETDPIFVASPAFTITQEDIDRWNEAHSWGNHADFNYITIDDVPTGFLKPGDNVSLLVNDVPYLTEAEAITIIESYDFVSIGDLEIILNGGHPPFGRYVKVGDPISYLVNDVGYVVEAQVRNFLFEGKHKDGSEDPSTRGRLERKAVSTGPKPPEPFRDNVSELYNDAQYVERDDYIQDLALFLRRAVTGPDGLANPIDNVSELINDVGYLTHTYDNEPLLGYDLEVLSNVEASGAVDGDLIAKSGDNWVPFDPLRIDALKFVGPIDVSFPPGAQFVGDWESGMVGIQYKANGNSGFADPAWDIVNFDDPVTREVEQGTYVIFMSTGRWVLAGKWNDQLQSDWAETETWSPAYIKNKPENLSDFNDDVVSDARVQLRAGHGLEFNDIDQNTPVQFQELDFTLNQFSPAHLMSTLKVKASDNSIIIDGNGISVNTSAIIGDGSFTVKPGYGIIVQESQSCPHSANSFCDTEVFVSVDQSIVRDLQSRIIYLEGLVEGDFENKQIITEDPIVVVETDTEIKFSMNYNMLPGLS